jgi:hypothetical protein
MTTIQQTKKLAISAELESLMQAIGGYQALRGISQPSSIGYSSTQVFFSPLGAKGTIWLTTDAGQVLVERKVFSFRQRCCKTISNFRCSKGSLKTRITELLEKIENQEAIDG